MASSAISAQGSKVSVNTGTSAAPVWTKVKNVKSFTGLDGTPTVLDASDLDSEAKEKVLGLSDNGSFSITVNRDLSDAGQAALMAAKNSGAKIGLKIELPDATGDTFDVLVKTFPLTGGTDALLESTIAMEVTGALTPIAAGG
ncbi:phage tail tube protein [Burkholderia gladioli]|uniref:phage tail tube protein n=1 Tax=Burkholderia gladioli TaxID=28095 RepID=UPI001640FE43|nr:phage tail tube protein [Burkholderia gladioli]